MLKISAKVEYALIALIAMGEVDPEGRGVTRIRQIADRYLIPPRFLVQILLQLKGAGFCDSERGASGGYRLTRPLEEISVGQIIEIIEGPCFSNEDSSSYVYCLIAPIVDEFRKKLYAISLRDVISDEKKMAKLHAIANSPEKAPRYQLIQGLIQGRTQPNAFDDSTPEAEQASASTP